MYLRACNGECPKNRVARTPGGEESLNYPCEGYRIFFSHADRPMRMMAGLIRQGWPAEEVMPMLAARRESVEIGRNDPCSCGSRNCCDPLLSGPAYPKPSSRSSRSLQ